MTAGRLWVLTTVFSGLLIASLLFAGARLGWHMGGYTAVLPMPVDSQPMPEGTAPQGDINAILALAPFGQLELAAPQRQNADSTVRLDIALRGVLVDPDPSLSRAYVLVGGKTSVLKIGDAIQLAELVAINTDTITLQVGDRLQIVGFGGFLDSSSSDSESPDVDTSEAPSDPFARLAVAIVSGPGAIELREGLPPKTTEDYIALWRDRINQNPQAAMDSVGVELVDNGYRIKADPDIGVTIAGLRPGDVVTRLNGQAVGDVSRDRELYDEVAASGIARLEVVRDGKSLLLTFPLR